MRNPPLARLCSAVLAASIAACSVNPVPRWSAQEAAAQKVASDGSIGYARRYAAAAKAAYDRALQEQLVAETTLGNGLLGIGAAIAAAAAFGAHRDAVAGGALAGGAAYAFGNRNISRQRQLVYLQAQKAITCAEEIIRPFEVITEADLTDLADAARKIEAAVPPLNEQAALVASRMQALPKRTGTQALLAEATNARSAAAELANLANNTVANAGKLRGKVHAAGGQLVSTVDKIRIAADMQIIETIPRLSTIDASLGGLGGYVDLFAPGAKVGDRVSKAMTRMDNATTAATRSTAEASESTDRAQRGKRRGKPSTKGTAADPAIALNVAIVELKTRAATLAAHVASAQQHLGKVDPDASTASLAGCAMPEPTPASPGAGGAGTTPPAAGGSDAPGSGAATGAASPPAPAEPAKNALATEIAKVDDVVIGSTTVHIEEDVQSLPNGRARVELTCESVPEAPLKRADVLAKILEKNPAIAAEATTDGTTDPATKIDLSGPPDCIEAASATAQRGARHRPSIPADDLKSVQARLCVDADGLWGPQTLHALDAWRKQNGQAALGGRLTTAEMQRILAGPKPACPA